MQFLVLEYVDGESLAERLANNRRLPIDEALAVAGIIRCGARMAGKSFTWMNSKARTTSGRSMWTLLAGKSRPKHRRLSFPRVFPQLRSGI